MEPKAEATPLVLHNSCSFQSHTHRTCDELCPHCPGCYSICSGYPRLFIPDEEGGIGWGFPWFQDKKSHSTYAEICSFPEAEQRKNTQWLLSDPVDFGATIDNLSYPAYPKTILHHLFSKCRGPFNCLQGLNQMTHERCMTGSPRVLKCIQKQLWRFPIFLQQRITERPDHKKSTHSDVSFTQLAFDSN